MSLLLDALKKAAQEKQKASEGDDKNDTPETENTPVTSDEVELTLDDDSVDTPPDPPRADSADEPPLELELEQTAATTTTVSDEALQLLVYKTNKQHRRSQKLIWGSIMSGALFILLAGGASYYYGMLEDVEALERKHKLAMRMVQSQPVARPHILQSMQQNTAEKQSADSIKTPVRPRANTTSTPEAAPAKPSSSTLSITRTEKHDPVNVLLNRAWKAYAVQDYSTAEKAYTEVLKREPNNRDALLGDAAIAVKEGKYDRARSAYSQLMQLDPRDPIATAGLANLDKAAPDTLSESKLKFMLQQQPNATHLHFALGNLYARQKKWPQAQDEYFNAWQGDSENADYAFNLAVSLDQIGEYREASRFYESSLVLAGGQNISFSVDAVKKRLQQLSVK